LQPSIEDRREWLAILQNQPSTAETILPQNVTIDMGSGQTNPFAINRPGTPEGFQPILPYAPGQTQPPGQPLPPGQVRPGEVTPTYQPIPPTQITPPPGQFPPGQQFPPGGQGFPPGQFPPGGQGFPPGQFPPNDGTQPRPMIPSPYNNNNQIY